MPQQLSTIPARFLQAGVGTASTSAEKLDGAANNRKAMMGVTVKNLDASIEIYVGTETLTTTNGFALKAGEQITISAEDCWNIYVLAASGTPQYTWIAS